MNDFLELITIITWNIWVLTCYQFY